MVAGAWKDLLGHLYNLKVKHPAVEPLAWFKSTISLMLSSSTRLIVGCNVYCQTTLSGAGVDGPPLYILRLLAFLVSIAHEWVKHLKHKFILQKQGMKCLFLNGLRFSERFFIDWNGKQAKAPNFFFAFYQTKFVNLS